MPVILLTARGEESDRIVGLRLGADDYVVKPFSPGELIARVKAVLRRVQRDATPPGTGADQLAAKIELDAERASSWSARRDRRADGQGVRPAAFLMRHLGQVFTRDELMEAVWRYPFYTDTATVTVHVRRVRQKIEADPLKPKHLLTVWGVGYKLAA